MQLSDFLPGLEKMVIDATKRGSMLRFVNHSCDPNCRIEQVVVGGRPRVGLFAIRHIFAGEELTYDYNFSWVNHLNLLKSANISAAPSPTTTFRPATAARRIAVDSSDRNLAGNDRRKLKQSLRASAKLSVLLNASVKPSSRSRSRRR